MKRAIIILLATALFTGCEDFLSRNPDNRISSEVFLSSENDLRLYANGLVNSAIPGESVAIGNSAYTDFCATKLSSDKYHPGIWGPDKAEGWSRGNFSFIRQCNYMIHNMGKAKGHVSSEVFNHYMGVARFWRAYAHMSKIKSFGDVPWIDKYLQPDDPILYAGRDDREYVFHKLLEDLEFASSNCLGTIELYRTNINRFVALAFMARACLYEGTYRKYHDTNPSTGKFWNNSYETSDDLIRRALEAADEIIASEEFSLHRGDPKTAYSDLFIQNKVNAEEVIWGREYSEDLAVSHDITGKYNSPTWGQQYSPTKEFVRMYLKTDGNAVTRDDVSITEEFEGRDWRMWQTVNSPGHMYQTLTGTMEVKPTKFNEVFTGYAWIKWNQEKAENFRAGALCYNALPIIRYAEVLLIKAEAAELLGSMDETVWSETIGALRERAGVTSIYPVSAAYIADSWLRDYYTVDVKHAHTLSNTMLEIMRERAVELAMESESRHDDLMRWNLGDLIERRYLHKGWRGIYVTQEESRYGIIFNGATYFVKQGGRHDEYDYPVANTGADQTFSLSEGSYGYLIYNYRMEWEDKMYLSPIPTSALNVNKNLGQNNGW